jgi:hypothetical protein
MRIKSLSTIASFLVFSLAITSCLNSDNNYELSSDNLITAFSLDTIYGVTYTFTIDQVNGQIFNADSVAYGADTIINKILIKTLTTNGYVTAGPDTPPLFLQDTIFNYTDSLDLSETMEEQLQIRVRSYDGLHVKPYSIEVRIHQVDPDSLVWGEGAYVPALTNGAITTAKESKAALLGGKILLFASDESQVTVYPETNGWQETDIAAPIKVSSIINLNDTLYAASEVGDIYYSANGEDWTGATTGTFTVENLITTFQSKDTKYISAIIKEKDERVFATAVSSGTGDLTWTIGEIVPDNFPVKHIVATKSYTTPTGGQQALLIGEQVESTDITATTPWFSTNGLRWGAMTPGKEKYALPVMEEPSILYYGNTIYAFGKTTDGFSYIYTSVNGIVWEKIEKKFRFPGVFKDRSGYAMVINDNYIWMFWNEHDEAWRGKLNRLGFEIQ